MAHSLQGLGKIPELRKRLLYTLGMLAVYRLGIFVTVPGIDREIMSNFIRYGETGLLGLADMFSGGAVSQMSVFALGVMPYISASIIFQLLGVVIPALERLQKEGDQGRRKINQYPRYATVALSIIQGFGISVWLQSLNAQAGTEHLVRLTGFTFKFLTVLSLTSGTLLLMWMGEQISDRGIGNGISMIILPVS